MPNQVTVSTITGTPPYSIYVCNQLFTACFYVTTIGSGSIPYTFNVPFIYSNFSTVGIKIVDTDGCIITQTVTF
jgi:hypothetical protein